MPELITTLLMIPKLYPRPLLILSLFACCLCGCRGQKGHAPDTIAVTPQEMQAKASDLLKSALQDGDSVRLNDSILLRQPSLSRVLYEKNNYEPLWCREEQWLPEGRQLIQFIQQARLYGLFPSDYHGPEIATIAGKFDADSLGKSDRKNVTYWTHADIMLTDAFIQSLKDIKSGRLPADSITLRKDSVLTDEFYLAQLEQVKKGASIEDVAKALEPQHPAYQLLKNGIRKFLDSATFRQYTKVPPPGKDAAAFNTALQHRLFEEGFVATDSVRLDSAQLAEGVKKFQKNRGIAVDGKAGEGTVRMLNLDDEEKFVRIAISMDEYKMLPEKMPARYIWVNLPSFYMQVFEGDSAKLTSKIICGKSKTRTPVLTSAVSELITYPQWVPPPSIVQKEILPAVKKNPGYLAKKGFSLVDSKGEEVDPYSVDWSKYSKSIPYRVVQGSGDDNALGIMKFVFSNKYSVYLHDTNQRYLFGQSNRSLSHGCVRVQEWEKLAYYLIRNDSLAGGGRNRADSVRSWLSNKQKKSIPLKQKMPVFIRYITCEGKNGGVAFYDDIYGDYRRLAEKYFAGKK